MERTSANTASLAALFCEDDGVDLAQAYLEREGLLGDLALGERDEDRIPPDYRDLARLHAIVRERKAFTVLEFGIGYSTIVLADALFKNRQDWERLREKPSIRQVNPFELHSVDASAAWIERAEAMVPERLAEIVVTHHSDVTAGTFQGRMCHYYDRVPNVVPDVIYLDGPDPAHIQGDVGGLTWQCPDRVVMAADILRMELVLLPGTIVVVDGRTSNVRFMQGAFCRSWTVATDTRGDVSVFELNEPPLGAINARTLAYRLGRTLDSPQES